MSRMPKDRHVGKLSYVKLPTGKRFVWRWIVRKREDGRYIVRIPKGNPSIATAALKHDSDFSKEGLLPIGTVFYDDVHAYR